MFQTHEHHHDADVNGIALINYVVSRSYRMFRHSNRHYGRYYSQIVSDLCVFFKYIQ